ncbi:transposase [Oligoflexia bacterium]|nr:transposase [Oligoflexia bacterium]
MALHTAGALLNSHPHIHSLSLHGAIDGNGKFHELDSVEIDYLTRCFADYVFEALLKEELLDKATVASMKCWEHSGFHVFVGEPIAATDSDARQFVARYLKKSAISNARLELIESETCPAVRINKINNDELQSRDLEPLQFLAELQQHIPDMWEQTTRYTGCYSARARGAKRLALDTAGPLPEVELPARPSKEWARCMKQVFEFDPLKCPQCGGRMHIMSFIHNQNEIRRICDNLGIQLWRAPPPINSKPLQHAA